MATVAQAQSALTTAQQQLAAATATYNQLKATGKATTALTNALKAMNAAQTAVNTAQTTLTTTQQAANQAAMANLSPQAKMLMQQNPGMTAAQATAKVDQINQAQAAQAAAAKAAADKAAAQQKAAADAAAAQQAAAQKAAADKAAADAAAAKTAAINQAQNDFTKALNTGTVTQDQLNAYTKQVTDLGGTPQSVLVSKANNIIAAPYWAQITKATQGATTPDALNTILDQAKAAGVTLDPGYVDQAKTQITTNAAKAQAAQQTALTNQYQTQLMQAAQGAVSPDALNAILDQAKSAGVTLDQGYIDRANAMEQQNVVKQQAQQAQELSNANSQLQSLMTSQGLPFTPAKDIASAQQQFEENLPKPGSDRFGSFVANGNFLQGPGGKLYQATPQDLKSGNAGSWYTSADDGTTFSEVGGTGPAIPAADFNKQMQATTASNNTLLTDFQSKLSGAKTTADYDKILKDNPGLAAATPQSVLSTDLSRTQGIQHQAEVNAQSLAAETAAMAAAMAQQKSATLAKQQALATAGQNYQAALPQPGTPVFNNLARNWYTQQGPDGTVYQAVQANPATGQGPYWLASNDKGNNWYNLAAGPGSKTISDADQVAIMKFNADANNQAREDAFQAQRRAEIAAMQPQNTLGDLLSGVDNFVRDTIPGGWMTVVAISAAVATGGLSLGATETSAMASDAAAMAAEGQSAAEISSALQTSYGIDAAAADTVAGTASETVAAGGATADSLAAAGVPADTITAAQTANASGVASSELGSTLESTAVAPEAGAAVEGAIAPEAIATPVTESAGAVESTALPEMAPVAPEAAAPAAIPETAVPTVDAAGNAGYYDTATGQTLDASGQVAGQAPVAPSSGVQVASTEPGAGITELNAQETADLMKNVDPNMVNSLQPVEPVPTEAPYRVEVSGAAGTADAPGYVSGPLSEGSTLATQAQVDAGSATWNAASNAWEVPAASSAPLSAVTPTALGGGELGASYVTPVVAGGGAAIPAAAIVGGGLLAAGALGGAGAGAGAGGAPVAAAPTTTPYTPLTVQGPVTPAEAAVGGVSAPGTAPVTGGGAGTATGTGMTETVVPGTGTNPVASVSLEPVAPTTGLTAGQTAAIGAGVAGAAALGAGSAGAGAGTAAGTGGAVAPVATANPNVVTPVAPAAPLSPVQNTVIPPGTSAVAPVEAQVVAPTDGLPPVVDATPTPVTGNEGIAGAGGLSAADLAKIAAGWILINGILTPPGMPGYPAYGPIPPTDWGSATPLAKPGMNPGMLMGIPKPVYQGTPTQSYYSWGQHPYVTDLAHIQDYNNIPAAPAWGAAQAAGTGANRMNLGQAINQTLGRGQAVSAYPHAVAPQPMPSYTDAQTAALVNAALLQGQLASGAVVPVAPAK